MNNIYKVIWSKAKNCYVVASEIARSHTKSATGSEKIGGVTKRSLLASLMALSLLCGGLGVASAANSTVHVEESASGVAEVYTKTGVDTLLADYGRKTEVETNKNNIATLQTTTMDQGKQIAINTTNIANNIANNKAAIDAVTTALADKADKTYVDNAVANAVTAAGNDVNTKLANYATTADVNNALDGKANKATTLAGYGINDAYTRDATDTAITTKVNEEKDARELKDTELSGRIDTLSTTVDSKVSKTDLNTNYYTQAETNAAIKTAVDDEKNARENAINGEVTNRNKAIADAIAREEANRDIAITKAKTELQEKVKAEETARKEEDAKLEGKITENTNAINNEKTAREAAVTDLSKRIGTVDEDGKFIKNSNTNSVSANLKVLDAQVKTNADDIAATDKRTGGITRNDAATETKIEGNVTVDNLGNVKAKGNVTAEGQLTGKGVDAGAGDITTEGAVKAGSLTVTDASNLKGDVTMDKTLSVTGDTKLGALNVTGESSLKNTTVDGTLNVNKETTLNDKLTANGEATFGNDVTVKGTTNLKGTTVDGDLKVTGTITTDRMVFGDPATNNYTEIDHGKVTSKNSVVNGEGQKITSSSIFNAEENKVGFANNATGDQSFHKQTSDIIMDNVKDRDNSNYRTQTKTETKDIIKDKDGNSSTTSQTASKNKTYLKDKDGKNINSTIDTAKGYDKTIKGENGETSTKQDELNITNTAKDGTITNDAQNIVNNASGNITNKANTMDTNVTGKATESYGELETNVNGKATENFKGGLKTDITGEEIHTVTGNQTNKVTGKQTNTVEGGQENIISGGQINNITGDQTTTISGTQTTTARDINRNASSGMIDTIDNAYGTNTETKVAGKTTTDVSIKGTGEKGQYIRGANESRDYLIKGTLKNSETKTAEATSTKITDGNGKTSSTIQDVTQISGSVTDGTNTSVSNVKANSIDSAVTDGSSISTINQKKNSITSQVTDGTTITKTEQDTKNITNTAKDGTITNDAKDIVNNASGNMTNTVGGDLTTTVRGNELHEVTGKQTNKIDGDQENTIGGNQTTTVTGDISNKAKNIINEASNSITDKVGDHTRVLDSEGITDTVGGSTFKQRIDKIMMESKDVSIKAEETLTNEAKVITNKASEVINNEAVNINNTATGIITSKAFEIKNQADKLISNKVGENTWENMENGKITTSIKDGAKQNLTQSDAAGTTQSTVDGGKSTVTIQNADGLTDAVTDGRNISVQNQTASQIAADVKDGAGNENASVATATTSANTIKNGTKANTVISTADGTSFINSEAAAPVTGASGAGTHLNTTIKGNTITTGKVTMDYAEVMKDLGVRGNANITGKTTTGSLEVKGESKLTGDVTMGSNATVKKDLTVEGNTNLKNTKVDGTLDVTQKANFGDSVSIAKDLSVDGNATIKGDVTAKSYKVGDKTYISAAGINANDQKITNVADGSISEGSKDAVNGGQLYTVKNDLEGKVNKVGANAAAMANLHPMEFDPSSKWNIAAAIGNYGSETAAALGAFYRPNDDVMVNLSTAFGTGENMVGGGVSVRLGKGGNKLSREENNALKDQVDNLTARMDALLSVLNPNMSKDFPDVPENHWAYEAVSRLAGNDIVQGYPDGEFHGERTMTRYEMAEIIYNALSRGAEAEKELVEEFKPELQAMAASEKATAERAEG